MSQPSSGPGRDDSMVVDVDARKRKGDSVGFDLTGEGEDGREEEFQDANGGNPGSSNTQRRALTLEDLLGVITKNHTETNANFAAMRGDVTEARRDASDAKKLAAKATTLAEETQQAVKTLEQRMARLESGEAIPKGPPGLTPRRGPRPPSPTKRDWDFLGGEEGDTLIVGGFRRWADREERQSEWDTAHTAIPEPMRGEISEVIVPQSQCAIVIVKIKRKTDPKTTRLAMIEWGKKFRDLALQAQAEDETAPRKLYAQPSKPYEMRQRDSKTTGLLEGFKLIAGEERSAKLRANLSSGRIFYERTLLAERKPGEDAPSPRMDTVRTIFPDLTPETLAAKVAEAMDVRERARKGP